MTDGLSIILVSAIQSCESEFSVSIRALVAEEDSWKESIIEIKLKNLLTFVLQWQCIVEQLRRI